MTDHTVYRKYNVSIECPHIKTWDTFPIQKGGSTTAASTSVMVTSSQLYILDASNFCGSFEVYSIRPTGSYSGYIKVYLSKVNNVLTVYPLQSQYNFLSFSVAKSTNTSLVITVSPSATITWTFAGISG